MAAHELKSCPRCQTPFECKPGNITECQCFGLSFTKTERDYIASAGTECLCGDCLMVLKREANYQQTRDRLDQMAAIVRGK